MNNRDNQIAALAPILALAGIFAHPSATVILPLLIFFIFHWQKKSFPRLVALRAADLAFSVQLALIIFSALLITYLYFYPLPEATTRRTISLVTLALILYLGMSLIISSILAFRGKNYKPLVSFRIGERVLNSLEQKTREPTQDR